MQMRGARPDGQQHGVGVLGHLHEVADLVTGELHQHIGMAPKKKLPPTPRPKGRQPTHPVDRIRTRLWVAYVKEASGLKSAYAIEMALDGDRVRQTSSVVNRPRKWDQYEKGLKVPDDRPGDPRNAIEQAETRFPGAARRFRSPLWRYLKGEAFDAAQYEEALRTLGTEVVELLLPLEPSADGNLLHYHTFDEARAKQLTALGSFDALVAAVLLSGLAEVIASPELRNRALDAYLDLQRPLRRLPMFANALGGEFFLSIDQRCKHWAYPSPTERLEIVIFSEAMPDQEEMGAFFKATGWSPT